MSRRRTTASLRPFVEVLEGRWVPTTLTPTTFLDGGPGSGSLRDAVLQFNADTGTDDDIIQLEAGTYALTIPNVGGRHEMAGLTGDLNLTQTSHRWIIQGAGPSTIIDAGQLHDRVFQIVNPGTQVVFQDLVIQGGLAQDNGADGVLAGTTDALGGGILNNGGNLTLDDVVVQNNVARGGAGPGNGGAPGYNARGSGLYSTNGMLTISNSTLAANAASGGAGAYNGRSCSYSTFCTIDRDGGTGGASQGGGLYVGRGTLTLSNSTIASNTLHGGTGGDSGYGGGGAGGAGEGSGLWVAAGVTAQISSTTIATNQATGGPHGSGFGYFAAGLGMGGGLYNQGTLTVRDCTLSGNSTGSYSEGGGIDNAGTLTVRDCTLSGNSADDGGGGIYNDYYGRLTVSNSTLSGNSAGDGVGIFNGGTLTVSSSTLSGNSAYDGGGGIYNNSGTLTVSNSTFFGNTASTPLAGSGGAIYNHGTLTVTDSALFGNIATFYGGGIDDYGTLTVSNSTLSGNSAGGSVSRGGAIYIYTDTPNPVTLTNVTLTANRASLSGGGLNVANVSSSSPILHNTLIAGNFRGATGTTPDDVYGRLDAGGDYNLIGDGSGMTGLSNGVNGNLVGSADNPIDPLLGPLADNGGPTLTHALLSGSPAIDAGNNAYATDWDQRGPGFPRIVNGIIDIGAFEVQAPAAGRPAGQPLPDSVLVQTLGTPDGSPLGQPPDLSADPSPLPESSNLDAPAGQSEPVAVRTAAGQQAPANLLDTYPGTGQPLASIGSLSANDLDALALNLLGGP
jgi:hypothetical protein